MKYDIQDGVLLKARPTTPLEQVATIPPHVTVIGEGAFEGCALLNIIYLPAKLTEIRAHAFQWCFGLEHLVTRKSESHFYLPERLTAIGEEAFTGCSKMRQLSLPASLEKLGRHAVKKCPNLESIYLIRPENYLRLEIPYYLLWEQRRTELFLDIAFGRFDGAETIEELLLIAKIFAAQTFAGYPGKMLTEIWLASHAELFFSPLVDSGLLKNLQERDRDTLLNVLRSERIRKHIPQSCLEALIVFANEQQDYELQLSLMDCKKEFDSLPEIKKRFQL